MCHLVQRLSFPAMRLSRFVTRATYSAQPLRTLSGAAAALSFLATLDVMATPCFPLPTLCRNLTMSSASRPTAIAATTPPIQQKHSERLLSAQHGVEVL